MIEITTVKTFGQLVCSEGGGGVSADLYAILDLYANTRKHCQTGARWLQLPTSRIHYM